MQVRLRLGSHFFGTRARKFAEFGLKIIMEEIAVRKRLFGLIFVLAALCAVLTVTVTAENTEREPLPYTASDFLRLWEGECDGWSIDGQRSDDKGQLFGTVNGDSSRTYSASKVDNGIIDASSIEEGNHIFYGCKNNQNISWEVVSVEGDTALLVCDNVLDMVEYGPSSSYDYGTSSLNQWCSNFYNSSVFSDVERAAILPNADGYKLFVLSKDEFLNCFPSGVNGYRSLFPGVSGYKGAYGLGIVQMTDENLTFWLRSTSGDNSGYNWIDVATYVNEVYSSGTCANFTMYKSSYGIVPALYLNLTNVTIHYNYTG